MLNLISNQLDIDKIYLYAKDPYEERYQYLINKREKVGLDDLKDPRAFIEYLNDMQDVYKNIEDYNPGKKRKTLIVFDDMIPDNIHNIKFNPVVTESFIRGRERSISIIFITQSYFKVPKDVRLNSTHFLFIMKIPNKRELQQIALNHSSNFDFKDFMKIYKKCFAEPYSNKIMTIEYQIIDEEVQYDIIRDAAKISALSSGKIDKYEHLTGEEILPSNQQQIIEQAKFTYSPLGIAFEKQAKTIKDQGKNQISAIKEIGKQIIESNEVAKNDFNIDRSVVTHEKQTEIFNELVKERALEFSNTKMKLILMIWFIHSKLMEMSQKILEIIKHHLNYLKI